MFHHALYPMETLHGETCLYYKSVVKILKALSSVWQYNQLIIMKCLLARTSFICSIYRQLEFDDIARSMIKPSILNSTVIGKRKFLIADIYYITRKFK